MDLIVNVAIVLIFLKLIVALMYFFSIGKKSKALDNLSIMLLMTDFLVILSSFFTTKLLVLYPFFMSINVNDATYIRIFYLIISFLLIIPYKGIYDNLISIHKFLISIYYLFSIVGYLIILKTV